MLGTLRPRLIPENRQLNLHPRKQTRESTERSKVSRVASPLRLSRAIDLSSTTSKIYHIVYGLATDRYEYCFLRLAQKRRGQKTRVRELCMISDISILTNSVGLDKTWTSAACLLSVSRPSRDSWGRPEVQRLLTQLFISAPV